jgi:hypothetical protein
MQRCSFKVVLLVSLLASACGSGRPGEAELRDSFAAQLAANSFARDVQRNGDEITFSGPAVAGGTGNWRVVVDSAVIEVNEDPARPYKGTVTSSWYSDGQLVTFSGRESNLPVELTSNGLAQECWALWNTASARWEWE